MAANSILRSETRIRHHRHAVLLTITTTFRPATDVGHLLRKHPERFGYRVRFLPLGTEDARVGAPTQMAIFERT